MSQTRKIAGLSALGLTTAVLVFVAASFLQATALFSTVFLMITGIQSMVAFWLLGWSLNRPGAAFQSIFVTDALLRLVGLGFAVGWLAMHRLPHIGALLILGIAYFLFSVVQIPFFHKAC